MDIKNLIKIGLIINLSYLPIKYKLTENKYNNYIDKTTNGIRINIDEYTNVSVLNNFKELVKRYKQNLYLFWYNYNIEYWR